MQPKQLREKAGLTGIVMNALVVHSYNIDPSKGIPVYDYCQNKYFSISIRRIYISACLLWISQMLNERFSPAPCAGCHTVWTLPPLVSAEELNSDQPTEVNPCGR